MAIILGSTGLICMSILLCAIFFSGVNMSPLYGNLSSEDKRSIMFKLNAIGVKFSDENDSILVPSSQVHDLRMLLARDGIPSGGARIGYEVFDQGGILGNSQFVNNINLTRALEGEISRTISGLSAVFSARVHLVLPTKEMFSKSSTPPSASVMLKLRKNLSRSEIDGIAHLLTTAVPELDLENITIIDDRGNPLKTKGSEDASNNNQTMLDYQARVESRIKSEIESLIGQHVGQGKVRAAVNATIDFDKETISYEDFEPDRQVIRSQKISNESDEATESNRPIGVSENMSNTPKSKDRAGNGRQRHASNEIINYEISRKVRNKVIQWGAIKKLSVAVLVDGIYEKSGNKNKYSPRSDEDLQKLQNLVSNAVGIDTNRGDTIQITNLKFSETDDTQYESKDVFGRDKFYVKLLLIIFTIIIGGLLIMRPFIASALKKRKENKHASENAAPQDLTLHSDEPDNTSAAEHPEHNQQKNINQSRHTDNKIRDNLTATFNSHEDKILSNVLTGWLHNDQNE